MNISILAGGRLFCQSDRDWQDSPRFTVRLGAPCCRFPSGLLFEWRPI